MTDPRGILTGLGLALPAAALASWAGVPAGALLGATAAVAAGAFFHLGPRVPDTLRNAAFTVIGLSLGAGIDAQILTHLAQWSISLAGLVVTMLAIMAVSGLVLTRAFGIDPGTTALSTSPGAMSWAVVLATEGRGDLRIVVTLQSLRLLLVTLCLPPAIAALTTAEVEALAVQGRPVVGLGVALLLLAGGMVTGLLFDRIRLPAPYLLAGLVLSGALHGMGLIAGGLPYPVVFLGFTVTGAVIGSRFTKISREDLWRLLVAGLAVTAVAGLVSAAGAGIVAWLTGLPFAEVWLAYAPGGVEGMAAIGLALGLDPAFVATHHILRIVLVIALLPLVLRQFDRRG